MHIEAFREYCLDKKHVTEELPFDEQTLVFKVMGKMFAIVPLDKWDRGEASITLKCDPVYTVELREQYESVYAGPYVSNKHWNTLSLYTGELKLDLVFKLIDHSYDMVVQKIPKKIKDKY